MRPWWRGSLVAHQTHAQAQVLILPHPESSRRLKVREKTQLLWNFQNRYSYICCMLAIGGSFATEQLCQIIQSVTKRLWKKTFTVNKGKTLQIVRYKCVNIHIFQVMLLIYPTLLTLLQMAIKKCEAVRLGVIYDSQATNMNAASWKWGSHRESSPAS